MTQEQKEKIMKLRQRGMSQHDIAIELGISQNTVKTFCRRNDVHEPVAPEGSPLCPQCKRPLLGGASNQLFCSYACKTRWWNDHHDLYKHTSAIQMKCLHCGKAFLCYEKQKRKFCSHDCYIEHRYGI